MCTQLPVIAMHRGTIAILFHNWAEVNLLNIVLRITCLWGQWTLPIPIVRLSPICHICCSGHILRVGWEIGSLSDQHVFEGSRGLWWPPQFCPRHGNSCRTISTTRWQHHWEDWRWSGNGNLSWGRCKKW